MDKYKYMTHRNWGGIFTIDTETNTIAAMHKAPEAWYFMQSIGWEIGGRCDMGDDDLSDHWVEVPTPNCHLCTDVPDSYEGCFCIEGMH